MVTTAAILSLASALSVQVFHLIGKWMEQKRQQQATLLIYQAAKENPTALKILADLEKQHTELSIKYGEPKIRLFGGAQLAKLVPAISFDPRPA